MCPAPECAFGLLDYGNSAALEFIKRTLSTRIEQLGIGVYRQDFNMDPLQNFRFNESHDRIGMKEIGHVTGLYALWDHLQQVKPGLIIDNCASGGRRLDIELMKRSSAFWRSDCNYQSVRSSRFHVRMLCRLTTKSSPAQWRGDQAMTAGISLWYPHTGLGSTATDEWRFRSGLGGFSHVTVFKYCDENASFWPALKFNAERFKSIGHLYSGDYSPMAGLGEATDSPSKGRGVWGAGNQPWWYFQNVGYWQFVSQVKSNERLPS